MYKNQLQELAQRSCFNLPSYACIREGPDHAPRFKATVNFNGETFESPAFCTTLRQAEHSAAEVALTELSKRGPSRSLAARVLDETGVYKNLLQETAHRAGLNLPVYTTVRSGPGHVPVFHCTVELAGLSFTGEPAKTKKQAQKNAAMAAWSVLKQLPHMQSSSSSSGKLETERKDEQEQIVVARALAKLCPSDAKRTAVQTDRYRSRQRVPIRPDMRPSSEMHLYPMQYPSWPYQPYSPEMAMFRMWQPEQAFQQQNCLLTLPMPPSPPGTQILPLVHSIFQPDHGQFILPRDKEPTSVIPGIPLSGSGTSSRAMPVNVRSRSQVTIQEIQEIQEDRPQDDEKWLSGDARSDGHKVNINSNTSVFPQFEVQNPPTSNKTMAEPLLLDKTGEDQKHGRSESESVHSVQLERKQSEPFKWTAQGSMETVNRTQATAPGQVEFRLGSLGNFDSSRSKLTQDHSPRPKHCSQPSNAAPIRIRTVGPAAASVNPRPETLKAWMPAPSTYRNEPLASPVRPRSMHTGGMRSFMAPAVQIRSVVPVCSAPPAKVPESGDRSKESEEVAAANIGISKLQI